jgi:hypothetical protein
MAQLQKWMPPPTPQQGTRSGGGLQQSASNLHSLSASPSSLSPTSASAQDQQQRFSELHQLLYELVEGYIMLKCTLMQLYQILNSPYSLGPTRPKDISWTEHKRVFTNLRVKADRAFTHPHLVLLKNSLLLPEIFLLEQCFALEAEPTMLPGFDCKHTMFLLMRIRMEQARWMNRLLTRDREGSMMNATLPSGLPAGSKKTPATVVKYSSGLSFAMNTVTFPTVLHWIHMFQQSLLSKSTLLFWNMLHAKSAEIRGYAEEMQQKLDRLDVNYLNL